MDVKQTEEKLTKFLATLKKNRDHVPLDELRTRYRKPYLALCKEIGEACNDYLTAYCLHGLRCNRSLWDECAAALNKSRQESGIMDQIRQALFKRQNLAEFKELAVKLKAVYDDALQSFYQAHTCLLITPECFDDPPAVPPIFNEATGYFYEDGEWVEKSGVYGIPMYVNSSKDAAVAEPAVQTQGEIKDSIKNMLKENES